MLSPSQSHVGLSRTVLGVPAAGEDGDRTVEALSTATNETPGGSETAAVSGVVPDLPVFATVKPTMPGRPCTRSPSGVYVRTSTALPPPGPVAVGLGLAVGLVVGDDVGL